jgi:hypothetical protein
MHLRPRCKHQLDYSLFRGGDEFGYACASTCGQTLDAQLEQLRAAGCTNWNIYREKVTGARGGRRKLLRTLDHLSPVISRP